MMGLETIKAMNEERAGKAKKENLEPFVIESQEQIDNFDKFPFAHLGDYRPKGWKLIDNFFVDSSGFGQDNEIALSFKQLKLKLKVGYGYAIIEAGQFQVYVGEFKRVDSNEL